MRTYKISIKDVINFFYLEGHISSTFLGKSRANLGTSIHTKLQKSRPDNYHKEYFLSDEICKESFKLVISGRADGIYERVKDDDIVIVEEIKSTYLDLASLKNNPNKYHLAQVICYAYLYSRDNQLNNICTHLTYYNLDNEQSLIIDNVHSFEELKSFYNEITEYYLAWINKLQDYRDSRDANLGTAKFPFADLRKGQRKVMVASYKTIEKEACIRIEAPTGIGKTSAVLFPALKSISTGLTDKLFYITNKGTISEVVKETINIFDKSNIKFKTVFITAKAKICFNPEKACDYHECEYAKDYFTKFRNNKSLFFKYNTFTKEVIQNIALELKMCPFELALDLSSWADMIVCDCNYFYDPKARLKRFFEIVTENYTLLFDEAHNVPERVRAMFSAELSRNEVLSVKREAKSSPENIKKTLKNLNKYLLDIEKTFEVGNHIIEVLNTDLLKLIRDFLKTMDSQLASGKPFPAKSLLIDFYFYLNDFVRLYELLDEHFVLYVEKKQRLTIRIYCLNPKPIISEQTGRIKSAIFFSATLKPDEYFEYLLNVESKENYLLEVESPFDKNNMCVMYDSIIDTTYKNRDSYYQEIALRIKATIKSYPGNYIVFFPSYKFLNSVLDFYQEDNDNPNLHIQSTSMTSEERQAVLNSYSISNNQLLFAISGGFFGEGIDLQGQQLIGCIVVGISLPMVSFERELIKQYFSALGKSGFDYAFKFPALLRIVQSAGRLIRTETDKGVLYLVDKRFLHASYKKYLPISWESDYIIRKETNLLDNITNWRKHEKI